MANSSADGSNEFGGREAPREAEARVQVEGNRGGQVERQVNHGEAKTGLGGVVVDLDLGGRGGPSAVAVPGLEDVLPHAKVLFDRRGDRGRCELGGKPLRGVDEVTKERTGAMQNR